MLEHWRNLLKCQMRLSLLACTCLMTFAFLIVWRVIVTLPDLGRLCSFTFVIERERRSFRTTDTLSYERCQNRLASNQTIFWESYFVRFARQGCTCLCVCFFLVYWPSIMSRCSILFAPSSVLAPDQALNFVSCFR